MNPNVTLIGKTIKLVALESIHLEELLETLNNPRIWEFTWRKNATYDDIKHLLDQAIQSKLHGTQLPFVIVEVLSGKMIGTTRIGDIDKLNQNAEIGWTWLSPAYWRTGANTECKFLLLQYCFEQLTLVRVQFSVSGNNTRSQRALERIGAIREGVFRKHRRDREGRFHDNVFYSITDSDWPEVKSTLEHIIHIKYE
ncbi:GNAT family N-acetyltransferase [Paenibacillus sp. 2TAB23]|uniref:GNAT family N-acetyltransferase n=1 Tax=Paenibacillus sp. 2TAB23 TaxID=3233004 RepID=UPI003F96EDAB